MPSIGLKVNYRPLRIGFCLAQNDFDGLRQVGIINSYLSGGIFNPIIVVADGDKGEEIINKVTIIRPDILLIVTKSLSKKFDIFQRNYLPSPFQIKDNIIYEDKGRYAFQVLDIERLITNIWETYMKTEKRKYSNCVLPAWKEDDSLSLLFALMFGALDLNYKFEVDYKKLYLKGLKAKPVNIEKEENIPLDVFKKITPLLFSAHDLKPDYRFGQRERGFVVGRIDNFNDLVSFWNFRTVYARAFFLPIDYTDRFKDYISVIKERISAITKNDKPRFHEYLLYFSKENENENEVKQIQNKYFSDVQLFRTQFRDTPYIPGQSLFYFEEQSTQGNIDESEGHFTISLHLPNFKYADKEITFPKAFFVASFSFLTEFEYQNHTLQLPNFFDLNEWYAREIYFQYDKFRVEPEGFGVIVEDNDYFIRLRPIYLPELLKKIFERSKINISPSEPGKIAHQIIEQMGGIEGCRVFKITGVRSLLSSLTPLIEKTRNECCERIRDRINNSFVRFEDLYIESREPGALTPEMAFSFLVKKKVFLPGVTIKCTKCDLKSWIAIKNISDIIECPLCGNHFSLLINNEKGITWSFRRSGLFGESNKQEGAIPVLLSLLQLIRAKHDMQIFTDHNLTFEDGSNCELDFIAFTVNRLYYDKIPEIVIGECKSPGLREEEDSVSIAQEKKNKYQVLDEDIENMVKIKNLLDNSGFRTYLLFSTTAIKFSNDELARFKELDKRHIPFILFTSNELEPYSPYERYKENVLPKPYGISLEDLCINSRFIYLQNSNPQGLIK